MVGVNFLHIVVVVERVDQVEHLTCIVARAFDGVAGDHGDLGGFNWNFRGLNGFAHGDEIRRLGVHDPAFTFVGYVFRTGIQCGHHQRVFVDTILHNKDLPALVEDIGDAAGRAQTAAAFLEDFADFAGGAVAVVGEDVEHDRHTVRAVPFVDDLFITDAFEFAATFLDGVLDRVLGHVRRFGFVDRVAQREVGIGIAPTVLGGNHDRLGAFAPDLRSLGILPRLAVLDVGPFAVTGHVVNLQVGGTDNSRKDSPGVWGGVG